MLDLLALTTEPATTPSRFFRLHAYEPLFATEGVCYRIVGLSDGLLARWFTLLRLPQAKTLLLQKKLIRPFELDFLRKRYSRIVYDFDDAIYLSKKGSKRFKHILRSSDQVVAGNRCLAAAAAAFQEKVTVIPTGVDLVRFVPTSMTIEKPSIVGWIGSYHNLKNLYPLLPVFQEVRDSCRHTEFRYICDHPDNRLNSAGWTYIKWSRKEEAAMLSELHIGLMPLQDTEYNRGKCGFKAIQYMAIGAPPIASPVGFNCELIKHGVNGLLPMTPAAWGEALQTLLADPDYYRAMRIKAIERAKDFDLSKLFVSLKPLLFPPTA
ncbi:MAG: hypothetical protein A2293_14365 [Elusimicrobia bacterium RIFOXYB2_FULL_49_7]|nr:MAG: hypothetical protein A2293_14365 [Elusimicrobia bacterium RIFOXYB2_FULL_49_7]